MIALVLHGQDGEWIREHHREAEQDKIEGEQYLIRMREKHPESKFECSKIKTSGDGRRVVALDLARAAQIHGMCLWIVAQVDVTARGVLTMHDLRRTECESER
jgi:hypothetical protein